VLFLLPFTLCRAQDYFTVSGLLQRNGEDYHAGKLTIKEDPAIDTLIGKYILYNMKNKGMDGFRIQVYNSSNKNAREESGKVRAEFISKFPAIISYASFERPGYYKIRAGDYRNRVEGTRDLLMVRRVFQDAILVHDIINFPDPNKK